MSRHSTFEVMHNGEPQAAVGSVFILFLDGDLMVTSHQQIGPGLGGFTYLLLTQDRFGHSCDNLGDLDADGVTDMAIGAYGTAEEGTIFITYLNSNGTVKSASALGSGLGGFTIIFPASTSFGASLTFVGNHDSPNIPNNPDSSQ